MTISTPTFDNIIKSEFTFLLLRKVYDKFFLVVPWTHGFSLKPSHLILVFLFDDMVGLCNNEGLVNVALSVKSYICNICA